MKNIITANIISKIIYFKYDNMSVFDVASASSAVVHSNKCFFDTFTLYIVLIIAFKDIYALNGKTAIDIIPLNILAQIKPILFSNFFCFLVPSFLNIITFNKSNNVGIKILENIIINTNAFPFTLNKHTNKKDINTQISNKLLLKLSNILNLDNTFNGF